jgi:hypothetical protein
VYTRTDSSVHSIPTHTVNRNLALEDRAAAERLRRLVHDNLDELIVENLSGLKSEAMLSAAVESWAKNENKRVLVLMVDMSASFASEKVNYARTCVEKNAVGVGGKAFVLLLHFPSSGRDGRSCYPALFLGGWEHFYLDGIGSQDQSLEIECLIEAACRCGSSGDLTGITPRIADLCKLLLPRVLPHIASQKLFYPNQGKTGQNSFGARSTILQGVLQKQVGDSSLANILSRKFASMWAEHGLMNSMRRATNGLLLGLTQLSLTMSMRTELVETFDTFVATMLTTMNQWRNLDLLLDPATSDSICELYGRILIDIPMMPFEELVLQTRSHVVQVSPLADPRNESARVCFPFFQLVSSFIDECIEKVEQTLIEEHAELVPCGKDLFVKTMDMIHQEGGANGGQHGRAKPVLTAIVSVEDERETGVGSLFEQYLGHFVEWRLGCDAQPFIVDPIRSEMAEYGSNRNIVAVHVAARVKSKDLATAASFQGWLVDSSLSWEDVGSPQDKEHGDCDTAGSLSLSGEALFERSLDDFEAKVFADEMGRREWGISFSTFAHQIPAMLGGNLIEDLRTASRLRILVFFYVLIEASAPTTAQAQRTLAEVWKQRNSMSDEDLIAALSLESLLSNNDDTDMLVQELLLRQFFAPAWVNATHVFKDGDVSFLLKSIADGVLDGMNSQLLISLLVQGCLHTSPASCSQIPCASEALASGSLAELGSRLSCDQISMFSPDGKRICVPHYVPDWLRRESVEATQPRDSDSEINVFLSNFVQCFHCRLASVSFDMLLQLHLREAETMTSENLFVDLLRCIHNEVCVDRLEQTRLSRSRRVANEYSVLGSPLGAIVLDIQLICFVAKVAQEFSVNGSALVLSGVYADEASSLIEEVMGLSHLKWQEFFVASILRTSGEGTLTSALGPNGQLSQMDWSQQWTRGIPAQMNVAAERLRDAEAALAEAVRDEERNSRELRLCPHCRQPFSVLQLNCGSFTCGRDFHGGPLGHGCGQTFQLEAAPQYSPDESLLISPLRDRLAAEQATFREHEAAASQWDSARGMQVPVVSFKIEADLSRQSMLPCSSFLSLEGGPEAQSNVVATVQMLLEGSKSVNHFSMLPDLVEVRLTCYC